MKVRWLSSALTQLDRIFEFVATDDPRAARRTFRRIREATLRLEGFPESGRPGDCAGTRELIVTGLPYLVVYRLTPDAVEILRVLHTSTNWQTADLQ